MTEREAAVAWLERNYNKTMQPAGWRHYVESEGLQFVVVDGARGRGYLPMLEIKTDTGLWCEPMRWEADRAEGRNW